MAENETPEESEATEATEFIEAVDPKPSAPKAPPTKKSSGSQSKGKKFKSDKPSMGEILRMKKPNTRTCVILLDSSLNHKLDALDREIDLLQRKVKAGTSSLADNSQKKLDELISQYEELEQEAEQFMVEFKFQDIGRKAYDALIRDNPPSTEEKEEYKAAGGEGVLPYSFNTFPPRLLVECSVDPKIELEEAEEMFESWAEGDLELLFNTALMCCKEPTSLPKSRAGIEKIRASQQNSTTVLSEESPTPNS